MVAAATDLFTCRQSFHPRTSPSTTTTEVICQRELSIIQQQHRDDVGPRPREYYGTTLRQRERQPLQLNKINDGRCKGLSTQVTITDSRSQHPNPTQTYPSSNRNPNNNPNPPPLPANVTLSSNSRFTTKRSINHPQQTHVPPLSQSSTSPPRTGAPRACKNIPGTLRSLKIHGSQDHSNLFRLLFHLQGSFIWVCLILVSRWAKGNLGEFIWLRKRGRDLYVL